MTNKLTIDEELGIIGMKQQLRQYIIEYNEIEVKNR